MAPKTLQDWEGVLNLAQQQAGSPTHCWGDAVQATQATSNSF